MKWSSETPSVAGWYWWRNQLRELSIVEACVTPSGKLCINGHPIEYINGRWAGPIPAPEEGS